MLKRLVIIAMKEAEKSAMEYRHGSVAFSGKKIHSTGYNRLDTKFNKHDNSSIHAEIDSISRTL